MNQTEVSTQNKNEKELLELEQHSCFNKTWLLQLNSQEQLNNYICLICKQITNNPIKINCPQHKDNNNLLIVGKNCLKQFLNNNNNICPIEYHNDCKYYNMEIIQNQINELDVICLRQYKQEKINSIIVMCDFKGKIKNINDHLNNSCPLKIVNCWFKQFGCNYSCIKNKLQDHLISEMKYHFDLVMKRMEIMQEEMKQLQLENEKLKLEIQLKEKEKFILQKEEDFNQKKNQTEIKQEEEELKITQNNNNNNNNNNLLNFDLFFSSSKLINTLIGHNGRVWSIDYLTFDNNEFICSGSHDNTIRLWDIKTYKQIQIITGHLSHIFCVKFSSYHFYNNNRITICSSSSDRTIRLWDIQNSKQLQIFNEHTNSIYGIVFSQFNGGKYLCSASYDKSIRLWDIEISKSLYIFKGHINGVLCVDISLPSSSSKNNLIGTIGGNGYNICSGSADNTIRIWDIETNKQLIIFKEHNDWVKSIKYGSYNSGIIGGSNTILSGSHDKSIRLWDIRSNQQIQIFKGHIGGINVVEYSPFIIDNNSNIICSGSWDNTIRFWDIRSNKELYTIQRYENDDSGIYCVNFFIKDK
ncbi:G-protein beta WD-40 repeats containing protein [Reticulomyxa filosa]|uniref:G-protein beta WD-40 repeats containing protein n=1 Tax=Reticulomyxa filosa TaxID=46433 RepID=X6M8N2_RETFI|nr:G-protein beta WD-40 repeats containing protein [Reticulomyxa filosa]|eukprot:ETO09832.1 G-protein beta WD-40 repeats containing protein [Reticulomyxa filosa]